MKNGKARGLEGISVEMTKNSSEKLHKIAPEQWGRGFKLPCTKKGDCVYSENYYNSKIKSLILKSYTEGNRRKI